MGYFYIYIIFVRVPLNCFVLLENKRVRMNGEGSDSGSNEGQASMLALDGTSQSPLPHTGIGLDSSASEGGSPMRKIHNSSTPVSPKQLILETKDKSETPQCDKSIMTQEEIDNKSIDSDDSADQKNNKDR